MSAPERAARHRVAVVGAGVSGLTAAYRLRGLLGPDAEIVVCEGSGRVGGVLRTVELAGLPYDVGAEAYLARRPEVPALLAELGLSGQIVHPTGAPSTIRAGERTVPLPTGTLMGVPGPHAALDGLLSPAGMAAAGAEREKPLAWEPGSDVVLGPFLRERFGAEVADRLVEPLLAGVYAGRVDALGLRATIPALAAALDAGAPSLTAAVATLTPASREVSTSELQDSPARPLASRGIPMSELQGPGAPTPASRGTSTSELQGSISRAEGSPPASGTPVFGALHDGYAVLLDALLEASGAEIRLRTTVRGLARRPRGWRLDLGDSALEVDAVVLAVPAPAVRRLLAGPVPAAAAAAARIELASSAVVGLAFSGVTPPTTSGVLVAVGEPLRIKAATHSSTKWAHTGADGLVRLRASLGRYGEAESLQVDDAELVARARADLATLQGITAEPVDVVVQRWGGGLPQYGAGHLDTVAELERAVAPVPGLAVAGAALHGVGVPACVATAGEAAEQVAAALRAQV